MPAKLIEPARDAYSYPLLIKHLLNTSVMNAPEQEIVSGCTRRYNYRVLRQRVGQLATGLARLGVEPGDTVAVMDWDTHRYLECYFAVPMMGALLQTINFRLSPEQILYTLNHAESDVLLVHTDFLHVLEQIKDRVETVRSFVLISDPGEAAGLPAYFAAEYEQLVAESSPDYAFSDFDENTPATLFYTTGTTGLPKGVYFSHRQLVLHTLAGAAALSMPARDQRFHNGDVYMPLTPMFHVHAWGMPYIATLMGVKQVYPSRCNAEAFLRLIEKEKVTFSHCVPTLLHMLLNCPASRDVDLSGWKVVTGGSALTEGLAKQAAARGIDIFAGYGMSETCPLLTLSQLSTATEDLNADEQLRVRIKGGRPIPLVDLRIVDEAMNDLPHDGKATGEIVARAPWLTQGYLKNPESSQELWRGGYLHTGDLANINEAGYVEITDRAKDVIKSGGEWISSLALESLISQHSAVSEVAVIGVEDHKWGERPLPFVVLKPGLDNKHVTGEIRAHLLACAGKGVISKWAVPETILFVDTIARTSVGKIDKRALRQRFCQTGQVALDISEAIVKHKTGLGDA
jgi:fatty-acyl-CoA synthase